MLQYFPRGNKLIKKEHVKRITSEEDIEKLSLGEDAKNVKVGDEVTIKDFEVSTAPIGPLDPDNTLLLNRLGRVPKTGNDESDRIAREYLLRKLSTVSPHATITSKESSFWWAAALQRAKAKGAVYKTDEDAEIAAQEILTRRAEAEKDYRRDPMQMCLPDYVGANRVGALENALNDAKRKLTENIAASKNTRGVRQQMIANKRIAETSTHVQSLENKLKKVKDEPLH